MTGNWEIGKMETGNWETGKLETEKDNLEAGKERNLKLEERNWETGNRKPGK